ncbi:MAG: glycerophosphodiester phosphodiesterase [Chloroflexi bacterium]|nr:glycerophosphodiester phosphodiesterase [Chloroflexota bacterium]
MTAAGPTGRALRLAHRGDWRVAPENTLAAMAAALANPACDGLEFDVRASRDGIPVLLHDETLQRVQRRAEAVSALDAGTLADAGVPTLAEVLALAGPAPFLDVELKGEPVPAVIPVLEAARGAGLARTVVSSFEATTLAWIGEQRPAWPRWLNAMDLRAPTLRVAADLGCRGLSSDWRAIDSAGIRRAAEAGLEVAAWTVRRRPTAARLERLGVIAICVEAAALDG